jgi:two-component system chemotaxis sensor kinase CheA
VQEIKPVVAAVAAVAAVVEHDDEKKGAIGANTIRVNVDVLESLMTMVSELVLTRNQLMQILRNSGDSEFKAPVHLLWPVDSTGGGRPPMSRPSPGQELRPG